MQIAWTQFLFYVAIRTVYHEAICEIEFRQLLIKISLLIFDSAPLNRSIINRFVARSNYDLLRRLIEFDIFSSYFIRNHRYHENYFSARFIAIDISILKSRLPKYNWPLLVHESLNHIWRIWYRNKIQDSAIEPSNFSSLVPLWNLKIDEKNSY